MSEFQDLSSNGFEQKKPSNTIFNILSRKIILIGSVSIVGMMTLIAYLNAEEKSTTQSRPITNKVDPNARKSSSIAENAPDSSPVKKQKVATEMKENLEAKEVTNSHVKDAILLDSTPKKIVNKDSASDIEVIAPTVVTPEPPAEVKVSSPTVTPVQAKTAKNTQPEVPREERIRQGVELLTTFNSPYLGAESMTAQAALKNFNGYMKGISTNDVYASNTANVFQTEYGKEKTKQQLIDKQREQQKQTQAKDEKINTVNDGKSEIKPENYLMQFGDSVMATVLDAFSTDFSLPVAVEIWQPPLEKVRAEGGYEWDEYENGIVLRFRKLYPANKQAISIDAFGVDVEGENTPLFDQDINRHYIKRFWGRASAAFIAPWIDFATTTSQIITNGEVIEIVNPVASTTDKMIGSLGNVAKEFLPDLARNADKKPTANLPQGYPVKLVFLKPLISLDPKDNEQSLQPTPKLNGDVNNEQNPIATTLPSSIAEIKNNVITSLMNKG